MRNIKQTSEERFESEDLHRQDCHLLASSWHHSPADTFMRKYLEFEVSAF